MSSSWGIVFYIRNIILLGSTTNKHYSCDVHLATSPRRRAPFLKLNAYTLIHKAVLKLSGYSL